VSQPHIPVLLDEVIAALDPKPGDVIVDATFGAGGYTRAILDKGAQVHAFDRDPDAIANGAAMVAEYEDRLVRIMERDGIDRDHAAGLIADRDRARKYHFKRFFCLDNPEDVHQFHVCINTSEIDFEYATGLVIRAAEGLATGQLRTGVTSGV